MLQLLPEDRYLAPLSQHPVDYQGITFTLLPQSSREMLLCSLKVGEVPCQLWLECQGWHEWLVSLLGTAEIALIDANLLTSLMQWRLSPLLAAIDDTITLLMPPVACSLLNQLVLSAEWTMDDQPCYALLTGWPPPALAPIVERSSVNEGPLSAESCLPDIKGELYAGWCQLPLAQLKQLSVGQGLRIHSFGQLLHHEFALQLPSGAAAHIRLEEGNTMTIDNLVPDINTLMADELRQDECSPSPNTTIVLEQLPQTLLVEAGQITLSLGTLRTLHSGALLPISGALSPSMTLRLNGAVVGHGELIACHQAFIVRISDWYLHSEAPDTENT